MGIFLLVAAVTLLAVNYFKRNEGKEKSVEALNAIKSMIPDSEPSMPYTHSDERMPVIEYDGTDYCAIIDLPRYSREFCVRDEWKNLASDHSPVRFFGSMYTQLIIGAGDSKGSFDLTKQLFVGDEIRIGDMSGTVYSYSVSDIRDTKDVSYKALSEGGEPLIIFVQNTNTLNYTLILCEHRN